MLTEFDPIISIIIINIIKKIITGENS